MLLLARLPNGTQHTKFILASGEGIEYSKGEDGTLTQHLWERHWDKVQGKIIYRIKCTSAILHLFLSAKRIKLCKKKECGSQGKVKRTK